MREAMDCGYLGQITTPKSGNKLVPGRAWCGDNSAFTGGYPGDEKYLAWPDHKLNLAVAHITDPADRAAARTELKAACRFIVAPDIPFDAAGTLALSSPMLPRIRALGFPVALCAQDGLEHLTVPWNEFDVLFIAGSTEWKVGPHARVLTAEAKRRGKKVHMGRVNSLRRLRIAASWGVDTADGTLLAFGPNENLPSLLDWLNTVEGELPYAGEPTVRQISRGFVMPTHVEKFSSFADALEDGPWGDELPIGMRPRLPEPSLPGRDLMPGQLDLIDLIEVR